jgi:hypothetical protein
MTGDYCRLYQFSKASGTVPDTEVKHGRKHNCMFQAASSIIFIQKTTWMSETKITL